MKRCENGHFYEPDKHGSCPYCGVDNLDLGPTRPAEYTAPGTQSDPKLAPQSTQRTNRLAGLFQRSEPSLEGPTGVPPKGGRAQQPPEDTRPRFEEIRDVDDTDGQTVGLNFKKLGIDPVVGWLVCTEGADKGRDYRIRSENNFLGRGENMHIVIQGDSTISRERHAVLSYDPKTNSFTLLPGSGRGIVHLNGEPLYQHRELSPYDEIELGNTKLMFVPFCGPKWQWK